MVISEFLASGTRGLADEDGEFSDWVELHNTGATPVNLDNWFLTDDATRLTQWRFPATNMPPGGYLVLFASSKNRKQAGAPLHTNFKLSTSGEYLALVRPDGITVESAYAPTFPAQIDNVSYGLDTGLRPVSLLSTNSAGYFKVPADGALGSNWTLPSFDAGSWRSVTGAVGFAEPALDKLQSTGLLDGLAGYWKLDESTGTNFADASPLGNNGVILGYPPSQSPWTNGLSGRSVRFRGTAARAVGKVADYPKATNALTVSAWVLVDSRALWGTVAKNWSSTGGQFQFGLREAAGDLDVSIRTTSGIVNVREGIPIATGVWQHVSFTADGSTLSLFRNGVLVGRTNYQGSLVQGSTPALGIGARLSDAAIGTDTATPGQWNGRLDEVAIWNRSLSEDELGVIVQAGTRFDGLIRTDVKADLYGKNSAAYLRFPFVVENPSALVNWRLSLRYDEGVVMWLNGVEVVHRNAPDPVSWNSVAIADRPVWDANDLEAVRFDSFVGSMVAGTNVLAVQVLSRSVSDHDMLCEVRLDAFSTTQTTNTPAYFVAPTPGSDNRYGSTALGPILSEVSHTPATPRDDEDLQVTARVAPTFGPIGAVTLRYRVMYSNEVAVAMLDDGLHGDGLAGDGLYGAVIPALASGPGQMVRYALFASDTTLHTNRLPQFLNRLTTEEYYGTVILNPAVTSALPVMQWFVKTPSSAAGDPGTSCSLYYDGEFYDNATVRIRGGTSRSWPKISHKVELPDDHEFRIHPGVATVTEFDWNTTYTDKSFVRATLVSEHQLDAGMPSPEIFPIRLQQNGKFFSVTLFTEQPDRAFLRRRGMDDRGSLYKCGPGSNGETPDSFEHKTRKEEGNLDLKALIAGVALTGTNLERYVFDNMDLPGMVSYMATVAVTQNIDASDKNYFLYRDTEGTGEWRMLPWDLDLTFGPDALNTDNIVYNANGTSHPFIGARPYLLSDGKYCRFLEAMTSNPRTRQMLLRRTRTLTDRFLAKPYFQNRMDQLAAMLGPDVVLDRAKWGADEVFGGTFYTMEQSIARIKTEYLAPRVGFLTGLSIPGVTNWNPSSQSYAPQLEFAALEVTPTSGNQDEEYIQIVNPGAQPVDISGWKLRGDVDMEFKPGTVVPTNSSIYVSPNVAAFRARSSGPRGGQSLFVQGNYSGRLSARGGDLRLLTDIGREIASVRYSGSPSLAQSALKITEIMYFPPAIAGDSFARDQYEFVEIANQSDSTSVSLAGVRFVKGVQFTFGPGTSLAAGQRLVLVKNLQAFQARYGNSISVGGQYLGSLENGREGLRLEDALGEKIQEFAFNNDWEPLTDGLGFSLVPADEKADWAAFSERAAWRQSQKWLGSPGQQDGPPLIFPKVVVNEVRTSAPDAIELFNAGTADALIENWFLSDDFNQPRKFKLPTGTRIAAGGYLLFPESAFGAGATGFHLQADGDEVWIFSANGAGELTGYYHGFKFGAVESNLTLGRVVVGGSREYLVAQKQSTLGQPNSVPLAEALRITEIAYHPRAAANEDQLLEFIELRNTTAQPLNLSIPPGALSGWRLNAGVEYRLPTNLVVGAGGFLVVVSFDPAVEKAAADRFKMVYGLDATVTLVGPWKGALNNSGDRLELLRPIAANGTNAQWVVASEVTYEPADHPPADGDGASLHLISLDLLGEDPVSWIAALPSPGRAYQPGPMPGFTLQPVSQRAIAFQDVAFTAAVAGQEPTLFQWRWNGDRIDGAVDTRLALNALDPGQFGSYQVSAVNAYGARISSNALLTVDLPPFIILAPQSRSVLVGKDVTFTVGATGTGLLRYQWRKSGVPIPSATGISYTLSQVGTNDSAVYDVLITDDVGTMASPKAVLTVLIPPTIVGQPDDATVLVGQTLRLLSSATGTPPLTYRWRRGTGTLSGQTNALLQSTNIQLGQAGGYTVIIGNAAGSVTSRVATVTVLLDVDRDGMADVWEAANGLNAADAADALLDSDQDHASNRDEYVAGTDPHDASSYLHWEAVETGLVGGELVSVLSFQAVSNHTYAVEGGPLGASIPWTDRWSFASRPTNSILRITNAIAEPQSEVYRIRTPRTP